LPPQCRNDRSGGAPIACPEARRWVGSNRLHGFKAGNTGSVPDL
jgi:hypothetical protein